MQDHQRNHHGIQQRQRPTKAHEIQEAVVPGGVHHQVGLVPRSAAALPRLEGPLAMASEQLSNASLFELLEP